MVAVPALRDSGWVIEERLTQLERRITRLERHAGFAVEPAPHPVPDEDSPPAPMAPPHAVAAPVTVERVKLSISTSEAVLKWAGIALVVLAAAFALGLAVERGWVTPTVRLLASGVVAAGLFLAGQRIRGRRRVFADTLQGAGFVVAYLTALGALVMGVVGGGTGFVAMITVTLAALLAAASLDSPPIAVLAVLGGLATPLLLESGIDDPVILGWYVPLMTVAGLAVFAWTGWRSVAVSTAGASWVLLVALLDHSQRPFVAVAVIAVGALLWLVPLLRTVLETRDRLAIRSSHVMEERLAPFLSRTTERLIHTAPIVTLLLLVPVLDLSRGQWSAVVAGTGALFACVAAALARPGLRDQAFVHVTVAAMLLAVGVAIALEGDVLLVALALQVAVLVVVGERLDHRPMRWQALVTLAIALVAVIARAADRGPVGPVETAEWVAEATVLGVAAWRAIADRRAEVRSLLSFSAHMVAVGWLLSVLSEPGLVVAAVGLYALTRLVEFAEMGDFQLSNRIHAAALVIGLWWFGSAQYAELLDSDVVRMAVWAVAPVTFAVWAWLDRRTRGDAIAAYAAVLGWIVLAAGTSDAWITTGWVVVGLAALAAGVRTSLSQVQVAGWSTLGLATTKLLLHDLESTDPLVRIALFFGIGLAFLALAYLLPTRIAPGDSRPESPVVAPHSGAR